MDRDIALVRNRLGPHPEKALRAFVDLGLNDVDIGRYHSVPPGAVSSLRKHYHITASDGETLPIEPAMRDTNDDMYLAAIRRSDGDISQVYRAAPAAKPDTIKAALRQFALTMRSKLFDKL